MSPEDVSPHRVNEWVQEQAQFLSPTQNLLLWYLSANAFRSDTNPEDRKAGDVLSGRTALHKIRYRTGLSERAVRDALRGLQEAGYIIAQHQPGRGQSKISVFWDAVYDDMREEFRAGIRDLPKPFQRGQKTPEKPRIIHLADIIPFPGGNK